MRRIILFLLVVVFAVFVSADEVGLDDSYDWLISKSSNGSYNNNVVDTAMAAVALNVQGSSIDDEVNYIISKRDGSGCWPKGRCKVKDTAFAMYALFLNGENISSAERWLSNAQTTSAGSGEWRLQVATVDSGVCTIKYNKGSGQFEKKVEVEEGTFPSCGGKSYLDLINCFDSGLANVAYSKLTVDCSDLSNVVISLVYKVGNEYYLIGNSNSNFAELMYGNGCFGTVSRGNCDYETSLYVNWILKNVESDYSSVVYLRVNHNPNSVLHDAFMYLITGDDYYLDLLKGHQRPSGSFENNVLNTAVSMVSLRRSGNVDSYDNAKEWVAKQIRSDGSFGNVFTTAMVLYSLAGTDISLPSCTDGRKNQGEMGRDCGGPCEKYDDCCDNGVQDSGEDGVDCGGVCTDCDELCDYDDKCEPNRGESCYNCPDDCPICEDEPEDEVEVCDGSGICDINLIEKGLPDNEDSTNCPTDCFCGDGLCDDAERANCNLCPVSERYTECADYCEAGDEDEVVEDDRGFGWFFWFVILILLAGLGFGGWYYYTKYYKKKGGKADKKDKVVQEVVKKPLILKPEEKKEEGFFDRIVHPFKKEKHPLDDEIDKAISEARTVLKEK